MEAVIIDYDDECDAVVLSTDYGWNECAEIITQYVNKKCAESAEQARKEAADSAVRYCKEVFGIEGLNTLRAAILSPLQNVSNDEQVPAERNKLECIKSMRATLLAIAQTPIAYVCEKTRKLARAEWEKSKGFEE